jgi:hypothetical protein
MRLFTLDLIERFGSSGDRISLAAQEELERRSQEYTRSLVEDECPYLEFLRVKP